MSSTEASESSGSSTSGELEVDGDMQARALLAAAVERADANREELARAQEELQRERAAAARAMAEARRLQQELAQAQAAQHAQAAAGGGAAAQHEQQQQQVGAAAGDQQALAHALVAQLREPTHDEIVRAASAALGAAAQARKAVAALRATQAKGVAPYRADVAAAGEHMLAAVRASPWASGPARATYAVALLRAEGEDPRTGRRGQRWQTLIDTVRADEGAALVGELAAEQSARFQAALQRAFDVPPITVAEVARPGGAKQSLAEFIHAARPGECELRLAMEVAATDAATASKAVHAANGAPGDEDLDEHQRAVAKAQREVLAKEIGRRVALAQYARTVSRFIVPKHDDKSRKLARALRGAAKHEPEAVLAAFTALGEEAEDDESGDDAGAPVAEQWLARFASVQLGPDVASAQPTTTKRATVHPYVSSISSAPGGDAVASAARTGTARAAYVRLEVRGTEEEHQVVVSALADTGAEAIVLSQRLVDSLPSGATRAAVPAREGVRFKALDRLVAARALPIEVAVRQAHHMALQEWRWLPAFAMPMHSEPPADVILGVPGLARLHDGGTLVAVDMHEGEARTAVLPIDACECGVVRSELEQAARERAVEGNSRTAPTGEPSEHRAPLVFTIATVPAAMIDATSGPAATARAAIYAGADCRPAATTDTLLYECQLTFDEGEVLVAATGPQVQALLTADEAQPASARSPLDNDAIAMRNELHELVRQAAKASGEQELSAAAPLVAAFVADLENPDGSDGVPAAVDPDATYKYENGFAHWEDKVREHEWLARDPEAVEYLITATREGGMRCRSKQAPPRGPESPLRGIVHTVMVAPGGDLTKVQGRVRRYGEGKRAKMHAEVDRWIEHGWAKDVTAEQIKCAVPTVVAAKYDTQKRVVAVRLCGDFSEFNKHTETDPFPMPRIADQCRALAQDMQNGLGVASVLDGADLYLQIEVDDESSKLLNLMVDYTRVIRFVRMPFGLKNAGPTCQRAATVIFPDERARKYADDVGHAPRALPASEREVGERGQHTPQKWAVLELLRVVLVPGMEAGYVWAIDKMQLFQTCVRFLGYSVVPGAITVPFDRLELLTAIPRPHNNAALRRALGRLGDARHAVPRYSMLAAPLTDAMRKGAKLKWTPELTRAWMTLVAAVGEAVRLHERVPGVAFQLECDASDAAIWWAWFQVIDGIKRYLAMGGRKCRDYERTTPTHPGYSIYEKEVLAAVDACQSDYAQKVLARNDVEGVVHSDNNSLVRAMQTNSPVRDPTTLKPVRRALQANVMGLGLRWVWVSGKKNVVADQGARQFVEQRPLICGTVPNVQLSAQASTFVPASEALGEDNEAASMSATLAPLSADTSSGASATVTSESESSTVATEPTSASASEPTSKETAASDEEELWASVRTSSEQTQQAAVARGAEPPSDESVASGAEESHSAAVSAGHGEEHGKEHGQKLNFAADESHEGDAGSRSEAATTPKAERRDERDERAIRAAQRKKDSAAKQVAETVEFAQSAMRELFEHKPSGRDEGGDENESGVAARGAREQATARAALNEDLTRWAEQQRVDPTIRDWVTAAVDSGLPASSAIARRRPALDSTGRVFVFIEGRGQPVLLVPKPRRLEIMRECHGVAGTLDASDAGGGAPVGGPHGGVSATQALIRQHFYWPGIDKDVAAHVQECTYCQQFKGHVGARVRHGQIGQYDELIGRFEYVHGDLAEMPVSRNGNRYFAVFIDRLSGAVETCAIPNKKGKACVEAFRNVWLHRYGAPRVLVPDGAGELGGSAMQAECKSVGTKIEPVAPRNPAGNGLAERAVDLIKRKLTVLLHSRKTDQWDEHLRAATFAYMCAVSAPRRVTPFQLVTGTRVHTTLERKLNLHHDERYQAATGAELLGVVKYKLGALEQGAREGRVAQASAAARGRAKKSGGTPHAFSPDDIVWLENDGSLHSTKFENRQKRSGPYQIVRQDPSGKTRYQLKDYYSQRVIKYGGFGKHRRGARFFPARLLTPVVTDVEKATAGQAGDESRATSDEDKQAQQLDMQAGGGKSVASDSSGVDGSTSGSVERVPLPTDAIEVVQVLGRPRADATSGFMVPVRLASGESVELPGAQFPDLLKLARSMGARRGGQWSKKKGKAAKSKAVGSGEEQGAEQGGGAQHKSGSGGQTSGGRRERSPRISTIRIRWRRGSRSDERAAAQS